MADPESPARVRSTHRMLLAAVLCLLAVLAYLAFRPYLSLEALAARENSLRDLYERHPAAVISTALFVYVLLTGFSVPISVGLSLAFGWFFGFTRGLVLASLASTAGATIAFLLSRFLFREAVRARVGERLTRFDESLRREGPWFLFTLRLMPPVPFFVVNNVMGLLPIRTSTFWWVSQLGMLPATAIYAYAGSSVPSLEVLGDKGIRAAFTSSQIVQLAAAFMLIGVLPLFARWALRRVPAKGQASEIKNDRRN